ncbi:HypC/HybG/HupF family hydrogenase formation chaperone [Fuerstiella marisgermanici]|uniref:Hydrogenase isoenzymes formation protein HypC n=1 Tax=Fuerstiella marisgermanici TaxID=1891926 RepID=A0A1P8WCD8_9PLAN|nr:HypC/HybG/HupF family hydrogenase formation chaperone [Fuerstiella marisgermanici]APZ91727.1 Hydrogenase isoenzymes formation protein HypC [Fuerstiella marisgermanici]
MCLGVPGRIIKWTNTDPTFASAQIEFSGVARECSMACVPDAKVGDYVVVHAGIAISRIDETAARQTIEDLKNLGVAEQTEDTP